MMYKQLKTAIILLVAFATGCECSNKEEPGSFSYSFNHNDTSSLNTQTPPPTSSSQYALQLIGLESYGKLADTNEFTIRITKADQDGTLKYIFPEDLATLKLTATNNVNDATAATLKGVDPLKLENADIQVGEIEKLITINRGTAKTTFTITLTHTATTPVTSTATVVAPSSLFDLGITLENSESAVHTGRSPKDIFKLNITSHGAEVQVSQLGGITLQYDTNDASNSLSYMIKGQVNGVPVQSGVTTLKAILEQNSVKKLEKDVPTTLQFRCDGTNPSLEFTNIKLTNTLDPSKPENYIQKITYNKPPDVRLTVEHDNSYEKFFTLIVTTTTELTVVDLVKLTIRYTPKPNDIFGELIFGKDSIMNNLSLASILGYKTLAPGDHRINCMIQPPKDVFGQSVSATFSDLRIIGSADETPVTVTYTVT